MKFSLCKARKQVYVMNTHYYGLREEYLYHYCSDDDKYKDHIRAYSREHAKQVIREKYPDARFCN
jgi:hypothetical protein